jgi:hypothetical protein
MSIIATHRVTGETLAELPTEQFARLRQSAPAATILELIQPITEPTWCVRCSPPDGRGNDFDGFSHLHISELQTIADVTVEISPDGAWTCNAAATVEIERLDYDVPDNPYRGSTAVRLNAHDAVFTPEGAIRYAEAIIEAAQLAIADRGVPA